MALSRIKGDLYLQHAAYARPKDFDAHPPESFREMARKLARERGRMNNKKFEKLEQCCGLKLNPQGILWDSVLQDIPSVSPNPVQHAAFDWQHTVASSGGVASYECNFFVRSLKSDMTITTENLDGFCERITWPSRHAKLPKHFFSNRLVDTDDCHMKAFANEILCAVSVLCIFIKIQKVQERFPALVAKARCMLLLEEILLRLRRRQWDPAEMHRLVDEHHDLYLQCYGFKAAGQPKLHYLDHIVDQDAEWDCWACERFNKLMKAQCANCWGPTMCGFAVQGALRDLLFCAKDAAFCQEYSFQGVGMREPELDAFFSLVLPEYSRMSVSLALDGSTRGRCQKGELVQVLDPEYVGIAEFFAAGTHKETLEVCYFAFVRRCVSWRGELLPGDDLEVCPARNLGASLAYYTFHNGSIKPLR